MAYSRTTWRSGETPLSAANMNNIEEGIAELRALIGASFDQWHPIGSYYETSDTAFDPNSAEGWQGTWTLENPGVVHVSAGTGYTAGSTGGSATKSYTPAGTVANHTLTAAESGNQAQTITSATGGSHSHTASASTGSAGNHSHTVTTKYISNYLRDGSNRDSVNSGGTNTSTDICSTNTTGAHTHSVSVSIGNHSGHTHSVTVGAKNAQSGHNHGFTGTAASIDVMQPYVVVNRWHRIA